MGPTDCFDIWKTFLKMVQIAFLIWNLFCFAKKVWSTYKWSIWHICNPAGSYYIDTVRVSLTWQSKWRLTGWAIFHFKHTTDLLTSCVKWCYDVWWEPFLLSGQLQPHWMYTQQEMSRVHKDSAACQFITKRAAEVKSWEPSRLWSFDHRVGDSSEEDVAEEHLEVSGFRLWTKWGNCCSYLGMGIV